MLRSILSYSIMHPVDNQIWKLISELFCKTKIKETMLLQCHLNDYECIILTIQCRTLTRASQRYMILNSYVSMELQWKFDISELLLNNRYLHLIQSVQDIKNLFIFIDKQLDVKRDKHRKIYCLCVPFSFNITFSMPDTTDVNFLISYVWCILPVQ